MSKREVRFQELVRRSGKPRIFSLWIDPKEDRSFMRAVRENRVLTLVQEPASKKRDFGRIGFHRDPHASYLVFPEALPSDHELRVIGVKYELIDQPRVKDAIKPMVGARLPSRAAHPKRRTRKEEKEFDVVVRCEAALETIVRVRARTMESARKQGISAAKKERFDLNKAVFEHQVVSVNELSNSRNGS